jgi:HAD superfamily hydrolase (TIGR01549 family)
MTISVIIPVYNTEQYLDRCLKSLFEQSYKDLQVIVVNDCSPGKTDEIIEMYKNKGEQIKYIKHQKNLGLFQARLTGAEFATGDYISFIDSDDYISFDYFRLLLSKAEIYDADIVIGNTVFERANGNKYIRNMFQTFFEFNVIRGKEIQERFFSQKGYCYLWHTIWNKIYKKKLWDECTVWYRKINDHTIMTEDIAFSVPLLCLAKTIASASTEAYFYCENPMAATNTESISVNKFKKNVADMKRTFDFAESFIMSNKEFERYIDDFGEFRKYYSRMWRNLADIEFVGLSKKVAYSELDRFLPNYAELNYEYDHFFEKITTDWNGGFEYIKRLVAESNCEYYSFDIFDTLIYRPLYYPEDLFDLLENHFEKLTECNVTFKKMRIKAEQNARRNNTILNPGFQDVNIDEIYREFEQFGFSHDVAEQMKVKECELEIEICRPRHCVAEIIELLSSLGKKMLIISDMYLDEVTINKILKKCKYTGFIKIYLSSTVRLTKYRGDLFEYAKDDLKCKGRDILHIGDNWYSDIERAKSCGYQAVFFPKAIETFENKIKDISVDKHLTVLKTMCGRLIDWQKLKDSLCYRTSLALIANKYFDNSYRSFNEASAFNADPFFIGYYPLGMHLLGITYWIKENVSDFNSVNFLARDGYLPMKAYNLLKNRIEDLPISNYINVSRRALLPFMLATKQDFYDLPIEPFAHSPKSILEFLGFATVDLSEEELIEILLNGGFIYNKKFYSEDEYFKFIDLFIKKIYNKETHEKAKAIVAEYMRSFDNGIYFDMGYSGRIQAAISIALGHETNVLFIHGDRKQTINSARKGNFSVKSFYDFVPKVSGLIREHIFSDSNPSCVGYEKSEDTINVLFGNEGKPLTDTIVIRKIQDSALDFCEDFMEIFEKHLSCMQIYYTELSMPFEGFLHAVTNADRKLFEASYFEDVIWGNKTKIKISEHISENAIEFSKASYGKDSEFTNIEVMLYESTKYKSKLSKGLVYFLLLDKNTLKKKTRNWLIRHPRLFKISYRLFKIFRKR